MTEEKFENYCNGLEDSVSNVLKLIQSNLKILSELRDKQKLLKQETLKLQKDMNNFKNQMESKFHSCLDKNKLNYTARIEGYERKSVLDDKVVNDLLPSPLKPSSINVNQGSKDKN